MSPYLKMFMLRGFWGLVQILIVLLCKIIKLCCYDFVMEVIKKLYLLLISHTWLIPDLLNEVSIGTDTDLGSLSLVC